MPLMQKGVAMLSNRMPKVINPATHAIIDYAVAATFFAVSALFWNRNKRAAVSSIVCGLAAATNSMLTDYPGGVFKVMSYRNHGRIDMGLAGITATMPDLMQFADEKEARFFELQAIAETAVAAMTDFEALDRTDHYLHRAA
jgi:hypothetical protein